jgi:acetate---CoA ligase (ADP-forming)
MKHAVHQANSGAASLAAGEVDLQHFFRPRSIAVVGAHESKQPMVRITRIAHARAKECGATFVPVNPRIESVFGVPSLASVAEITDHIDVLVILIGDAESVLVEAIAAQLSVSFVVVLGNGYSESGTAEGAEREHRLLEAVRMIGARLVGPNTNLNGWQPFAALPGRRLAMVSHSGAQGWALAQAQDLGVGISNWAPTGNEADLDSGDFIQFFVTDESTAAVCAYLEGFTSGESLRRAAIAAIENCVPIVLIKVGRTDAGSSMAFSHTAHLAGSDEAMDAFFDQFGIVRVDDLDQLIEVAAALARSPLPSTDGVVICSVSGGSAAHVADLVGLTGLTMPTLSHQTQEALQEFCPGGLRLDNPVDNGGLPFLVDRGREVWQACLDDPATGLLLCPIPVGSPGLTDKVVDTLIEVAATASKPILPIWSGASTRDPLYQKMWDAGLPVFRNIRNAVAAAQALLRHPGRQPALHEYARLAKELGFVGGFSAGDRTLQEDEASDWLGDRGFRFAAHKSVDDVESSVAAADEIGYPVVLKGRGVAHKSERGMVVTGISDAGQARSAAEGLLEAGATGLFVAEQVSGGIELLVGVSTDPVLGPVVVVGAGGVNTEAFRDVARAVLPLTRSRAEDMLDSLRLAPLLGGWRGSPAIDRGAVIDVIMKVAELAESGLVAEMDINPLLARPDGAIALDALVRLNATDNGVIEVPA